MMKGFFPPAQNDTNRLANVTDHLAGGVVLSAAKDPSLSA